jgi:hypothetical protein
MNRRATDWRRFTENAHTQSSIASRLFRAVIKCAVECSNVATRVLGVTKNAVTNSAVMLAVWLVSHVGNNICEK